MDKLIHTYEKWNDLRAQKGYSPETRWYLRLPAFGRIARLVLRLAEWHKVSAAEAELFEVLVYEIGENHRKFATLSELEHQAQSALKSQRAEIERLKKRLSDGMEGGASRQRDRRFSPGSKDLQTLREKYFQLNARMNQIGEKQRVLDDRNEKNLVSIGRILKGVESEVVALSDVLISIEGSHGSGEPLVRQPLDKLRELSKALEEREIELSALTGELDNFRSHVTDQLFETAELPAFMEAEEFSLENESVLDFATAGKKSRRFWDESFIRRHQEIFRGATDNIAGRLGRYLPYIQGGDIDGQRPVADIGCGRGEFLELLREAGVKAVGVDTDGGYVEDLKSRGYDVHHSDSAEYLRECPDGGLAGITAFHLIEHVDSEYLDGLIRLASVKIAPRGFVLIETPNPRCLTALVDFYRDPTHLRPVPCEYLLWNLRLHGFDVCRVFLQAPTEITGQQKGRDLFSAYLSYSILAYKGE